MGHSCSEYGAGRVCLAKRSPLAVVPCLLRARDIARRLTAFAVTPACCRTGGSVRIAWISFLDVNAFSGGGELAQRDLLRVGRVRGHTISESPFLRGRAQRLLRRSRVYRRVEVDWNADMFVLSNLRNCPQLKLPFPENVLQRVLAS